MATNWGSTENNITNRNSTNRSIKSPESKKQATGNALYGSTLSSWSLQQKIAMIAGFAILGLLLAVCACSKESAKPALVGVSSPTPASITPTGSVAEAAAPTASALPTSAKKMAKKRPANVTYSDANSGVSFLYPRKFALATGDKGQPQLAAVGDVPMNFVQPGGVAVATVSVPGSLYRGTDFESAFFNVNVNRNVSEEQCGHFAFVDTSDADGEAVDAERVKVGSIEMEMTSGFSANIMKQAETQYYHAYENGACYEYVLGLGTEGFATEGGIRHVDRDEVFARLEKILATVKVEVAEHVAEQAPASIASGKE
jgi:hypothetical protein